MLYKMIFSALILLPKEVKINNESEIGLIMHTINGECEILQHQQHFDFLPPWLFSVSFPASSLIFWFIG